MQRPSVMLRIACENTMPQRRAIDTGKAFPFIFDHLAFSESAYSKRASDDSKNRADDTYQYNILFRGPFAALCFPFFGQRP